MGQAIKLSDPTLAEKWAIVPVYRCGAIIELHVVLYGEIDRHVFAAGTCWCSPGCIMDGGMKVPVFSHNRIH